MTAEITDPGALLRALDAGAPERREAEELERLVATALETRDPRTLRGARSVLMFARRWRCRFEGSTARLDLLLERVRAALADGRAK